MGRVAEAVQGAVDWGIGLVSPRQAVIRAHLRRMRENLEYREGVFTLMRAAGYRAAEDGENDTPWHAGNRSPDGEAADAPTMRDRSRQLERDDALGKGTLGNFGREIVGTELRPQSRVQPRGLATKLEEVWESRRATLTPVDDLPFGEWQRLAVRSFLRDGDVFIKRAISRPGEPVWFETIEAERVQTPSDAKPRDPLGEIVDGVEKDRYSRPVAYWVLKHHPSDRLAVGLKARDFDRVPRESIRHVKLGGRAGQTRGVSDLHAVLQDIRDLDLLMLACLKRVQVAACLTLFIKSAESVPNLLAVTAESYGYRLDEELVPGGIFKLFPGEEVQTITPQLPVPQLEEFVVMLCRRIGAALGVSWQTILRDFSQSNYSSARTTLLADRVVFLVHRYLFREQALDWMWRTVMEDALLRGDERLAGVRPDQLGLVQWIADGWAWVDPLKEAQATQLELLMGITSLRDVCAAKGKDWEEVQDQRLEEELREQRRRQELGLPPRSAAAAPATPPDDEGEDQEDEDADRVTPADDGERRLRRAA